MCHFTCIQFAAQNLREPEVRGKRVLEVGSYDVNGSLRPVVAAWEPASYIGVDIAEGPGVDVVCDALELVERFGPESFDVVLSTEMLEHIERWQEAITNLKRVCAEGGIILLTTRSPGFPLHEYPADWWRFTPEDMQVIFADCEVLSLEPDPMVPGVFVKVRKPRGFTEQDLPGYQVFSMATDGDG